MNLKEELLKQKEKSTKALPDELRNAVKVRMEELKKQEIEKTALKKGDKIPNFTLQSFSGGKINIYDLLKENSQIVLNFFRGSWCPYCNLELVAYKEIYEEIKECDGDIVAISPGLPEGKFKIEENNNLPFEVLRDKDNKVGKEFGLVFSLGEELAAKYKKVGIDLEENQGNKNSEIPVPATYIVDKDGKIVFSYVDID
ncbi:MAG: peroxiredoxin-like family protein, partial [Bacillota bacterium]|nr:peroxiredoxin-like family protein [Bacillota bacterium]